MRFHTNQKDTNKKPQPKQYTNRHRRQNFIRVESEAALRQIDPRSFMKIWRLANERRSRPDNLCRQMCVEHVRALHPKKYKQITEQAKKMYPVQNAA